MRLGMVIDCERCIGCYNCFLTCQDEFCGNAYEGYAAAAPMEGHNWMRILEEERGQYPRVKVSYTPKPCMHCADAPCIAAAQNGAVYRRPDGIVVIDPVKAAGQKQLLEACPYRAIEWNEEAQLAQKCDLCAHALDKGEKEPRCVESCPTNAIVFGDMDDPASEISRLIAEGRTEALNPEFELKESVRYLGLPKRFIAGTVVLKDKRECAQKARVELWNGALAGVVTTNNFGDFEFDGVESNQSFQLKVSLPGYQEAEAPCTSFTDTHVGEIYLSPAV